MSGTTSNPEMLYRILGGTEERVSAIGLGGWHIGLKTVDEQLGIRIVCTAIDRGITFTALPAIMQYSFPLAPVLS